MRFYDKNELKDSRIFFDKQPKRYLTYFGYFIIFFILASGVLLKYLPKNYIVKAQGTIEANDKYYITPLTTANIIEIHRKEGDIVKMGDTLLTLSPGAEIIQEDEINIKINETEKYLEIFNKFEKSLTEKINLLKNEDIEQEYYGKVEYYLTQVKEDEKKISLLIATFQML